VAERQLRARDGVKRHGKGGTSDESEALIVPVGGPNTDGMRPGRMA
jgi:hypothetical protein